ncbi:MAG: IclR family transcriptional regulator [Mycobacterium sp.]
MTLSATATACVSAHTDPQLMADRQAPRARASGGSSRGVLDGAFAVLEALAHAHQGLGLTELARASGLAKTSAYRLAEQLVVLGAVQRAGHHYYVGARIGRLGRQWQPDPRLRQAAAAPVRALTVQSGAVATLRILRDGTLLPICTAAPSGLAYLPAPIDREATARSATGRVLYAATDTHDLALLPDCWTLREWRHLRESIRGPRATVVDHQGVFSGICCVSAPVWGPDGTCVAAITALVHSAKLPPCLPDLVWHAARRIDTALR